MIIENKQYKNNIKSIFSETIKYSWIAVLPAGAAIYLFENEIIGNINIILLVCFLMILTLFIILIFNYLRWKNISFYIYGNKIELDYKLFIKRKVIIEKENLAAFNKQQSLINKLFKLYSLKIDINSAFTAEKNDFSIIADESFSESFQSYIGICPCQKFGNKKFYSIKAVIRHCLLSSSVFSIIFFLSLNIIAFKEARFSWASVLTSAASLLPAFYSLIAYIFRYTRLKAERGKKTITITNGLITNKKYCFNLENINAVILEQPFLARFFGLYSVKLINAGLSNSEGEATALLMPLCKEDELEVQIQKYLPEILAYGKFVRPEYKAMFYMLTLSVGASFFALLFFNSLSRYILLLFCTAFFCSFLKFKTCYLKFTNNYIYISSGIFDKKIIIINYKDIQCLKIKSNPILNIFGLKTGKITILSSVSERENFIGIFKKEIFEKIENKIII